MVKTWQHTQSDSTTVDFDLNARSLHPIAGGMLARRGLFLPQEIEAFLNPEWETGIHDPYLFSQMEAAVARIFRALAEGQHIVIHGDYDADGVTGSVVLAETIKMLARSLPARDKIEVERVVDDERAELEAKFLSVLTAWRDGLDLDIYIPHREKEGYGLNKESVNLIAKKGANLLITVDCGIANVDEIGEVRKAGVDAIVVDHHQYGEILPDAILIHPRLPGETYPFKDLAAVGVAWKLASGLIAKARQMQLPIPIGWEKWLLDLVAIATITDIVPLIGENRVLEKFGLVVINKLKRPGIKALVDMASWKKDVLDSESIGFVLGPRINAAGRMEHAYLAVDLLLEEDQDKAMEKALALDAVNKNRQKATEALMQEAKITTTELENQALIFAWSDNWSPSLVGLAAGKFADAWGRPAIFVGKHSGVWIGSGRSIPSYDITEAVRVMGQGLLTRCGGHKQACGFSLADDEHVALFAEAMRKHAAENLVLESLKPFLQVEAELRLEELDWSLVETLKRFEPFGEKNPKPLFVSYGLSVLSASLVGANQKHLRAVLQSASGKTHKFIGFHKSEMIEILKPGATVDIVYEVGATEWNGRSEIQCKIIDTRTHVDN